MKLTPAMIRELQCIARDGEISDPDDWNHAPESLWFHTRDRVIGALLKRGLICDGYPYTYAITDAGKAVLAGLMQREEQK